MELEQSRVFLDTPALWESSFFNVEQFKFPEIDLTNFKPKPIPQNIRLGHQIEHLFFQLLEFSKIYKVVLFNQPIKRDKITIGEIDCIVQHIKNQSIIHIELTYKFYIIDNSITEIIHQLIGPNQKDSFYKKLQKIKIKQFKLIHTKEVYNILKYNNIDTINITSKVCFKAQLFTPYHNKNIIISPFNEKCIAGYWLRLKDFNTTEFKNKEYYLPSKQEWILKPHDNLAWKSFSDIILVICERLNNQNSPMVWMKTSTTILEKFFIVFW
mgnify:CR=1 FL=1|tara:strand:- start:15330 stop:16136 length:807 start_codon:yes stop_codon:yes gene_type:complete